MDEMDYTMEDQCPEPSTPRSHIAASRPPHTPHSYGCPVMRRDYATSGLVYSGPGAQASPTGPPFEPPLRPANMGLWYTSQQPPTQPWVHPHTYQPPILPEPVPPSGPQHRPAVPENFPSLGAPVHHPHSFGGGPYDPFGPPPGWAARPFMAMSNQFPPGTTGSTDFQGQLDRIISNGSSFAGQTHRDLGQGSSTSTGNANSNTSYQTPQTSMPHISDSTARTVISNPRLTMPQGDFVDTSSHRTPATPNLLYLPAPPASSHNSRTASRNSYVFRQPNHASMDRRRPLSHSSSMSGSQPSREHTRNPTVPTHRRAGSSVEMPRLEGDSDDDYERNTDNARFLDILDAAEMHQHGRLGSGSAAALRNLQLLRGGVKEKRVASQSAVASLESVDVQSLSETERTCVICYNEFGKLVPEGFIEAPLRLPKCKHIFGDHCIKKWFSDSDSCPYCRAKVPSEVRITANSQTVEHLLRAAGRSGARFGAILAPSAGSSDAPPSAEPSRVQYRRLREAQERAIIQAEVIGRARDSLLVRMRDDARESAPAPHNGDVSSGHAQSNGHGTVSNHNTNPDSHSDTQSRTDASAARLPRLSSLQSLQNMQNMRTVELWRHFNSSEAQLPASRTGLVTTYDTRAPWSSAGPPNLVHGSQAMMQGGGASSVEQQSASYQENNPASGEESSSPLSSPT